ncbi:peptide-methionine (S)-S-oxide reductase MsrA [Bacillaceae bacterium SIJ1]|uniref:peptide-methionine (S)-S-oxide reductase MsrA n=1 Tax=Litoribacterium kuwaitense TaxID=1398745 RepID=UPI0013E9CA91|nr:peptide-methionine (S)-S-oxide reductase MsrA [Litoribacterium kuwaitense]NGP43885.1 peptide-methionine (S)-S-oxide reductase MsrA [Litoribacterium kuwaitense]
MEKATFGAGCFWGVELAFSKLDGVESTRAGYIGGTLENPTYEEVCKDNTGHAEAVEIMFDPQVIRFETLLTHFWEWHDPTTVNRQGEDVGTQYRSAIFYHNEKQKKAAEDSKRQMDASGHFKTPIVTEITKAATFFPAEEYHQKYLEKRGQTSCSVAAKG